MVVGGVQGTFCSPLAQLSTAPTKPLTGDKRRSKNAKLKERHTEKLLNEWDWTRKTTNHHSLIPTYLVHSLNLLQHLMSLAKPNYSPGSLLKLNKTQHNSQSGFRTPEVILAVGTFLGLKAK